jgi:hypothetical protein
MFGAIEWWCLNYPRCGMGGDNGKTGNVFWYAPFDLNVTLNHPIATPSLFL